MHYTNTSKLVYIKSIEKETLIKTNSTLKNQETKCSYKKKLIQETRRKKKKSDTTYREREREREH